MNKIYIALSLCVLFFASCTVKFNDEAKTENKAAEKPSNTNTANAVSEAPKDTAKGVNVKVSDDVSEAIPVTKSECLSVDTGDNEIVKNQTFPIDFAPFTKSCFVTSHNPEYDDPPMEAEFSIYKNGERVFDFPGQFNGVTFGCWVDGVAFEDLNDDNLKDVIVVGKCSAKTAPYNENMVYVNTGRAFTTDEDANYKLSDFKKIKEITDFVRKNQQTFFK
ncbi:MAG: hypothetical protein LUM44_14720 [Pyrinomonadaceae bacterium]|nr:hypothetical protein [Pyrinomonadaceae bacterium]